ncbi:MAG: hypothetical protein U0528_00440 [Anaerolineae bacterium]
MRLRILFVIAAAVLVASAVLPQHSTSAYADATSVVHGCSSFSASGTTNAPLVAIYAYVDGNDYVNYVASSGGTFSGSISFPAQPDGTVIIYEAWGGSVADPTFTDPGYWDGEDYYFNEVPCSSAGGPYVPAGWTQHWMTCSSAVFDAPGGNPIGTNAVWAGQSFYVNPATKTDASGKSWSQVFVSSAISPWIPTSCVG